MFLSIISIVSKRKLRENVRLTATVLKRLLITKKSEGVYSYEPDLMLHTSAPTSDSDSNSTGIPQNPYYERPTPVVFICGEGLPAKM